MTQITTTTYAPHHKPAPGPIFAFQEKVVQKLSDLPHPALFMEMRLGKTYVAIDFLTRCRKVKTVLVISPLSVVANWQRVLSERSIESCMLRGRGSIQQVGMWNLINFEQVLVNHKLVELPWDAVIVDESTRIKNPNAKSTKLISSGFDRADTRMILSGAPAPEDIADYFSQFQFLHGHFMGFSNFWRWRHKYYVPGTFDWQPRLGTRTAVKSYVHDHAINVTRAQLKMAPKKIYQVRVIPMTRKQYSAYRQVIKHWKCGDIVTQWQVVIEGWLSRISGGICPKTGDVLSQLKAYEIVDLLQGELKDQQVIVFFRYNSEISLVARHLYNEFTHGVITGETPWETREKYREAFQSGRLQVMLLQVKVAKMGLDFSAADAAIYYSNGDSLEDRIQSEDRILHLKKRDVPLLYIDLITEGSVDGPRFVGLREKRINSRWLMTKVFEQWK